MPCYDSRDDEDRVNTQKRADAATRAACEMARVLRAKRLMGLVSSRTRVWALKHEEFDRERKEKP
jgi:hypothetical protein